MDKNSQSDQPTEFILAGIVGAVAGAVGAVVATAMLNKDDRQKLGRNLLSISEKVIHRLNSLNGPDSKQIPPKSAK